MMMTTTMVHGKVGTASAWSGIDAGRREQVDNGFANSRHFRFGRRPVKRTGRRPLVDVLELRGNAAYLRALRRAEMKAWQETGGDFYRPAPAAAQVIPLSPETIEVDDATAE